MVPGEMHDKINPGSDEKMQMMKGKASKKKKGGGGNKTATNGSITCVSKSCQMNHETCTG